MKKFQKQFHVLVQNKNRTNNNEIVQQQFPLKFVLEKCKSNRCFAKNKSDHVNLKFNTQDVLTLCYSAYFKVKFEMWRGLVLTWIIAGQQKRRKRLQTLSVIMLSLSKPDLFLRKAKIYFGRGVCQCC